MSPLRRGTHCPSLGSPAVAVERLLFMDWRNVRNRLILVTKRTFLRALALSKAYCRVNVTRCLTRTRTDAERIRPGR